MRFSIATGLLAASGTAVVSALAVRDVAPAIPLEVFEPIKAHPIPVDQLHTVKGKHSDKESQFAPTNFASEPTCSSVRVRKEWHSMTDTERMDYIRAVNCLIKTPASGTFRQAKNRYEDFVALHQELTPNVHGNSKFLPWHRYYIWAFEDELRSVCKYTGNLPWFDETVYAGNFPASSIFSSTYFGSVNVGGRCVTDGQFKNMTLNVGPGTSNQPHCLSRNNNNDDTANCASQFVNICQGRTDYSDYEACLEGGCHAYGHNGVGAVMSDVYSSPGDPVFFLHHGLVDRLWRVWQNQNPTRATTINGVDKFGNPLTVNTVVSIRGIRPDITIGKLLNTVGVSMCYKYNY